MITIIKLFFLSIIIYLYYKIVGVKKIIKLNIFDLIIIFILAYQYILIIYYETSFILIFLTCLLLFILELSLWLFNIKKNTNTPAKIYQNKKYYLSNILKYNITVFDFISLLKQENVQSIKDLEEIVYVNGRLKVSNKPIEGTFLITNGNINYNALKRINKDKIWLINNLNCSLEEVLCGIYKDNNLYIVKNN